MSTKSAHPKKSSTTAKESAVSTSHDESHSKKSVPSTTKESAMSTSHEESRSKKSVPSTKEHEVTMTTEVSSVPSAPQAAPVASPPTAVAAASVTSTSPPAGGVAVSSAGSLATFLTPPPAGASIPPVPSSFVPENGTNFRGVAPKKAELIALPLAVADLQKFTNYASVVGSTAPPYEEILATFGVTNQWSSMRTAASAWDIYSQVQEGICWTAMRPSMESLKSAFELAVSRDPSLLTRFAGLSSLLGAKASIAKRAAATKRLNKKAVAEGKAPTHGAVGKRRLKATNKAIVASASEKQTPAPVTTAPVVAAPVVAAPATVAPVDSASAPVAVSAAPVVSSSNGAATLPAAPVNGATTATNGAGH